MVALLVACSPDVRPSSEPPSTPVELPDVAPLDVACPPGVVRVGDASYDDLEEALAAAEQGDVVAIGAGRFTGAFGASVPLTIGGVGAVVLDAEGRGATLTVAPGTRILDLTVTGGQADAGGGIALSAPGELVLGRVTVTGNRAERGGGIGLPAGSSAWLVDATIRGNVARSDGGGLACRDGELVLAGTWIGGNLATNGGAIYAERCTIEGGELVANTAGFYGGGMALLESAATGVVIAENEGVYGGGLYALASEVASSVIERNVADEGDGVYAVAGLALDDVHVLDHAGVGLALGVDRADVVGGAVLGNGIGAASSGGLGQVLASVGTDWGDRADDNGADVAWGSDAFTWGGRATFTCAGEGCGR